MVDQYFPPTYMRSLADYEKYRATLPALAWLLLVHVLAIADPQGRADKPMGQWTRMFDVRSDRIARLLDELADCGVLTWSRDDDDRVIVQLA